MALGPMQLHRFAAGPVQQSSVGLVEWTETEEEKWNQSWKDSIRKMLNFISLDTGSSLQANDLKCPDSVCDKIKSWPDSDSKQL